MNALMGKMITELNVEGKERKYVEKRKTPNRHSSGRS